MGHHAKMANVTTQGLSLAHTHPIIDQEVSPQLNSVLWYDTDFPAVTTIHRLFFRQMIFFATLARSVCLDQSTCDDRTIPTVKKNDSFL